MFLNVHIIQSVPASCLNRDDTGSPKTMIFGDNNGIRDRLSSQSQKAAVRTVMHESDTNRTFRSTRIIGQIARVIANGTEVSRDHIFDATSVAIESGLLNCANLNSYITKTTKELQQHDPDFDPKSYDPYLVPPLLPALFYIDDASVEHLGVIAREFIGQHGSLPFTGKEHPKTGKVLPSDKSIPKEAVTKFKNDLDIVRESSSVEINLFGRMSANDPTLNIDAAAQVAHAMSVSNSISQSDFYTALDDLEDGHSGGAMMGTIEFSSPVFYRYANINLAELVSRHLLVNSREVITERVGEFIRAFITTLPSGKQSSFAAVTMPDAVLITLSDAPVNYANAFVTPISGKLIEGATKALTERHIRIGKKLGIASTAISLAVEVAAERVFSGMSIPAAEENETTDGLSSIIEFVREAVRAE